MTITSQRANPTEVASDLLVIGQPSGAHAFSGSAKQLNTLLNGLLQSVMTDEGFEGKLNQSLLLHTHSVVAPRRILVVGMGEKQQVTAETFRVIGASVAHAARRIRSHRVSVAMDTFVTSRVNAHDTANALVEGMLLGSYQFLKYKKEELKKANAAAIKNVLLLDTDSRRVRQYAKAIERAVLYAQSTMYVRDLVNEPAVHMTPQSLAVAAQALSAIPGVAVKIYDKAAIKKLKMGSFLAVAAGSDEEPYLIHLTYRPKSVKKGKSIAFCGKGITFDSGGLSLKKSHGMEVMKTDMAGAANILGVFSVIDRIAPRCTVHGVIVATENMPSGKATRPGDVVTAYNGTTIEITNTDAEGRLVLADALAWTEDTIKPDYIVDFATLTGSAIIALGQSAAAMFATDDRLAALYIAASEEASELTVRFPFIEEYRDLVKSPIADLLNASRMRWGDMILAPWFLRTFVQHTPWIHMDIAGPAWAEMVLNPYSSLGATGFGVRTTLNFIQKL